MMTSTGRDSSANKTFTRERHNIVNDNSDARVMKDRNKRTEVMLDDQVRFIFFFYLLNRLMLYSGVEYM